MFLVEKLVGHDLCRSSSNSRMPSRNASAAPTAAGGEANAGQRPGADEDPVAVSLKEAPAVARGALQLQLEGAPDLRI